MLALRRCEQIDLELGGQDVLTLVQQAQGRVSRGRVGDRADDAP